MVLTLIITVIGTFGSATISLPGYSIDDDDDAPPGTPSPAWPLALAIWRFIAGLGIGGAYPLAAAAAAELPLPLAPNAPMPGAPNAVGGGALQAGSVSSPLSLSLRSILTTPAGRVGVSFLGQACGLVLAPLAAYITVLCVGVAGGGEYGWRLLLLLGGLFPLAVIPKAMGAACNEGSYHNGREESRLPPPEEAIMGSRPGPTTTTTTATTATARGREGGGEEAARGSTGLSDISDISDISETIDRDMSILGRIFSTPDIGSKMVGTCGGWFLFDMVHDGAAVSMPAITKGVLGISPSPHSEAVGTLAGVTSLFCLLGAPSMLLSLYLIGDHAMGRRESQIRGFIAISGACVLFGLALTYISGLGDYGAYVLILAYGMLVLTIDGTPYLTTFVLPQASTPSTLAHPAGL